MRVALPLLAVAMTLVCACHGEEEEDGGVDADADSATLRREAMYEWYNDHKPTTPSPYWTRDYMKYVNDVAAAERARWSNLLPSPGISQLVTGSQWVNIGPTRADVEQNGNTSLMKTDSGRVRTILNTGTRLYVATSGGGVWRSDNDGATWTPVTESLGSLSIGSLAIDPSSSSVLYLGLGDPFDGTGIGFVKSTDGGNTWSSPVYLGDSSIIPQVFVQGGVVFVATDKGLYKSADGGVTFTAVTLATGSMEEPYVWSIASTGAQGLAIALEASPSVTTGTTDGQVWISSNNGTTWTRAPSLTKTSGVGRITLASAPSNRSIVYAMAAIPNSTASADMADIFKSTDGGATWTALGVTNKRYTNRNTESSTVGTLLNGQGWYNGTVVVNPTNPNDVWFGGALLIAESTDGGSTYTEMTNWLAQFGLPYVHADFHAATWLPNGTLYLGTDGGVFVTTDGGATFSDRLNVGLTTHLFYSVGSSPAAPSAVIGGLQDNGTRVRSGTTSTFNQYLGGDGFGTHMNQTTPSQMIGTLYYDRVYKSTDSGVTWSLASTGITESNNSTTATFITRINPRAQTNELYTFSNLKVYKTTNYAASWSVVGTAVTTTGVIRNVGVAWDNANFVGVVGSGGRVWLTSNGGATWTQVANGKDDGTNPTALPGDQLSLSDIRYDPADSTHNTIFVASVAPDQTAGHLWKTTNGGTTWTRIDSNGLPPGIPINLTKADPMAPNIIFAATHLGVYRSTDGGATWARFGAGMPLVNVDDLYISPDGSLVRAASFGRGVWELTTPPPDRPPVLSPIGAKAVNHGATLAFQLTATDPDGDPLTYSATGLPTGATLSTAGAFSYTPVCNDLGAKQVTFTVSDGRGGTDSEVVTITVKGGRVALTPTSLDFGSLLVGTTSTLSTSASSTGSLPITFATATTSDPAFTIPSPPSGAITTGTLINVKFTPTASQDYTSTLTVTVSDGTACTPSVTAALTGRARTASVDVSPMNKDFGDVRTDRVNAYPMQVFTVTNMGTGDLAVSDVVLDDATQYSLDKGGFATATTLTAGASATFTVTARPQTLGPHAATVTVMSNAPNDTAHVVALTENGVRPLFTASPASIAFGTTATPVSQMLTLSNTGTADLTFGTATVTGTSAGAFATSNLPATLAAGATFDLTVTYTPAGTDMASLEITSDADATQACGSLACARTTIALSGTADTTGTGSGSGSGSGSDDGGGDATGGCCDAGGGGVGGSAFLSIAVLGVVGRRRRRSARQLVLLETASHVAREG